MNLEIWSQNSYFTDLHPNIERTRVFCCLSRPRRPLLTLGVNEKRTESWDHVQLRCVTVRGKENRVKPHFWSERTWGWPQCSSTGSPSSPPRRSGTPWCNYLRNGKGSLRVVLPAQFLHLHQAVKSWGFYQRSGSGCRSRPPPGCRHSSPPPPLPRSPVPRSHLSQSAPAERRLKASQELQKFLFTWTPPLSICAIAATVGAQHIASSLPCKQLPVIGKHKTITCRWRPGQWSQWGC